MNDDDFFEKISDVIKFENVNSATPFDVTTALTHSLLVEREQLKIIGFEMLKFVQNKIWRHIAITGDKGTGKTALVNYLWDKLKLHELKQNSSSKINCEVINCAKESSTYRILKVVSKTKKNVRVWDMWDEFYKITSKNDKNIIVLDEADMVEDISAFLYQISRDPKYKNVMIIMITNKPTFFNNISGDVTSSMSIKSIFFEPYQRDKIFEILKKRADEGLKEYDVELLKYISGYNELHYSSDVRVGIKTLGEVFDVNRQNDHETKQLIIDTMAKAYLDLFDDIIKNLSDQELVLMRSIIGCSKISNEEGSVSCAAKQFSLNTDIYENFKLLGGNKFGVSRPVYTTHISNLEKKGLIKGSRMSNLKKHFVHGSVKRYELLFFENNFATIYSEIQRRDLGLKTAVSIGEEELELTVAEE